MKTRTIILSAICVFLMVEFSLAQQKGAGSSKKRVLMTSTASSGGESEIAAGTGLKLAEISLEGERGCMYLGEKWPSGKLILKDGNCIDNYRYRYDVYADQMQFISDNDTLAFAAPSELKSLTFDGMTFVYIPYECTGMHMKGYFELLVPGKKQLLLKRTVTYHLAGEEEANKKDSYLILETYFLKEGNTPAQKLNINRKSILNAVNDQRKEMDDYLRKTGNKLKSKEELKKFMTRYNSIL